MADFRALGEDEALAVGLELARRADLRPERHQRLPRKLVQQALDGSREAALELIAVKFRAQLTAVRPLSKASEAA